MLHIQLTGCIVSSYVAVCRLQSCNDAGKYLTPFNLIRRCQNVVYIWCNILMSYFRVQVKSSYLKVL